VGIRALYRSVFGLDVSEAMWEWVYRRPKGTVIVVLEQAGSIVGHYALQARPFVRGGLLVQAGLAVGLMVQPSARDVRSLVDMNRRATELAGERGMSFLYAFPNPTSLKVHRRLFGWAQVGELAEWEGPPPAGPVGCERGSELPASALVAPADVAAGHRDDSWIAWRFADKPGAEYVFHHASGSYAVTKRYTRDDEPYIHIVDWQVADDDDAGIAAHLGSIGEQASAWGSVRLSAWVSPASGLARHLKRSGLSPVGRSTPFLVLDLDDAAAPLPELSRWRLWMADSDVY
jgi:hypothetical protein